MRSPFPGMDPYLEARWEDVHQSLITYARDALQPQLPSDLRARIEQRVYVEIEGVQARRIAPDLQVAQYPPKPADSSAVREPGQDTVAEPIVFLRADEPVRESYIEIRDGRSGQVIAVLEVLSPANKAGGEGQRLYLQKQREILSSKTNLVEIDLVRSGQRVIAFPAHRIPAQHRNDALVCIHNAWSHRRREPYALPLRERLPTIPIPLRATDAPGLLPLQALLDQCYHNGRYDDIDYRKPPVPPLSPEDSAWAVDS